MSNNGGRQCLDLSHHLSKEARERLTNTMKDFFRTGVEDASQLISLANGDPHPTIYPISQVDYYVPDLTSLTSISSWITHPNATKKLSAFNGTGKQSCALDLAAAMQYGTGLGLDTLRKQFAQINEVLHAPKPCTQSVILTLGNADGVTKVFRLLGSPGDTFLAEEYSFCGLTNAPMAQGVKWQPIKIDHLGIIPEDMEAVLSSWNEAEMGRRPHVLYSIPTGQNPTGATLPLERRRAVYAIAQKYDIIIIEDDPYLFLQYSDTPSSPKQNLPVEATTEVVLEFVKQTIPSFLSLDVDGRVIRCDSVSKTFAPNMRLGWITSNFLFCRKLEILTDNSTQHPHGLGQSLMAEVLAPTGWGINGYFRWVWYLHHEYERRRDFFFHVFQREVVSGYATTTLPIAGLFFWVTIHIESHSRFEVLNPVPKIGPKTNTKELLDELFKICVKSGVLVMPGWLFALRSVHETSSNDHILDRPYFRVTFVGVDEIIEKGLILFGKALNEFFAT